MYTSDFLIAPRPVRIASFTTTHVSTSPFAHALRLSSPPAVYHVDQDGSDADAARLSPLLAVDRQSLSPRYVQSPWLTCLNTVANPKVTRRPGSEALDEFLSILRPAIPGLFAPQPQYSSSMRPRVYNIPSLHDRALSLSSPLADRFDILPSDGTRTPPAKALRRRTPALDGENADTLSVRSFGPQGARLTFFITPHCF
jgi:hypothetical protein